MSMTGIVFATREEARPLLERGLPPGVEVSVCGMGMEAAQATTEELVEKGAARIINAGVCGALKDGISRGSVHRISRVALEDGSFLDLEDGGLRLATVEKPVFEPGRRRELAAFADLVDMEGYAVTRVCRERGVPCILVKGITDFGDGEGKADIKRHIGPVSESVAQKVAEIVGAEPPPRDRRAGGVLRKLHSFTKIEHIVFSLPLLFAGAWLGAGGAMPPLRKLLLVALAGVGARTFGMALNRIFDREIDAKNPRTKNREIPAGKLSVAQGWAVALAGAALYFLACRGLGDLVLRLSLVPLVPLAVYSLLKRFTPLCHYGIGVALAAAPLGAFVAVSNSLRFTPDVLWLALFAFCWIGGFDIIYALMDIDFDRASGVRSIPAWLGARRAQLVAAATHLVAILALLPLVDGPISALCLAVAVAGFVAAYLPFIPLPARFFPVSAVAGIAGALVVLMGG